MSSIKANIYFCGGEEKDELNVFYGDDRTLLLQWNYAGKQYQVFDTMEEVIDEYMTTDVDVAKIQDEFPEAAQSLPL
jgi:predicted P-loop ATPase